MLLSQNARVCSRETHTADTEYRDPDHDRPKNSRIPSGIVSGNHRVETSSSHASSTFASSALK